MNSAFKAKLDNSLNVVASINQSSRQLSDETLVVQFINGSRGLMNSLFDDIKNGFLSSSIYRLNNIIMMLKI